MVRLEEGEIAAHWVQRVNNRSGAPFEKTLTRSARFKALDGCPFSVEWTGNFRPCWLERDGRSERTWKV
jgi:hypothetical protein